MGKKGERDGRERKENGDRPPTTCGLQVALHTADSHDVSHKPNNRLPSLLTESILYINMLIY